MLVLSRQLNEKIIINDDITIELLAIRGDKVRLGITAPSHIGVHRQEVYDAIKRHSLPAKPSLPSRSKEELKKVESLLPPDPPDDTDLNLPHTY